MKPFPLYVANHEEPDEPIFIKGVILVNEEHEGIKIKIHFGDLFCALQKYDLAMALIFAANNFPNSLTNAESIENFIKLLHKHAARCLVMINNISEPSGVYRRDTVITDRLSSMGVSVDSIEREMKAFCQLIYDKINKIVKPEDSLEVAVFALTELGRIHPFVNGNGRVARALANCILMHFGKYPPIVFKDKNKYYKCFEQYLAGNIGPFRSLFMDALKEKNDQQVELTPINEIDAGNCRVIIDGDTINIATKPDGYGITIDNELAEEFLSTHSNEFVKIFFTKLKQVLWPNCAPSALPKEESGVSSSKNLENNETQLRKQTSSFFKASPPSEWKEYPKERLTGSYIGHQVRFFNIPATESEIADTFHKFLKDNIGFDATKTISPKGSHSIIVDLTSSKLKLTI